MSRTSCAAQGRTSCADVGKHTSGGALSGGIAQIWDAGFPEREIERKALEVTEKRG